MPDPASFTDVDWYLDPGVGQDPSPYYAALLAGVCPVAREPCHGAVAVGGYEEVVAVYNDTVAFSNCNSMAGPFATLPELPDGVDDITDLVDAAREQMPMHEHLPMLDPPAHTDHRALLMRLITPKRLAENEAFLWRLADVQIDEFAAAGRCEFIREFSNPYSNLVITDLLGVPDEDRDMIRQRLGMPGPGEAASMAGPFDSLAFLYDRFTEYVEDRRANPRDDVLTGLATATFPDGSTPEVIDVVRIAAFLYAAGGETTARLLAAALRIIGEDAALQQRLRDDRNLLTGFIEEVLRLEGPVKSDHRLTRKATAIAGVSIAPGDTVALLLGAANRDPRRFDDPETFDPERPNARAHIAFGHGVHTCPGAPLARSETRIALERLLDRMHDIRISDAEHGPEDARRYEYAPTFVLRGLQALHLEFTPAP